MGRGIRVGLNRCNICGSASDAGPICVSCQHADTDTLKARNLEYLSVRFGPYVKKDPDLIVAAIERRFAGSA